MVLEPPEKLEILYSIWHLATLIHQIRLFYRKERQVLQQLECHTLFTVPAWFYAHFLQPNPMYVFYVTRGLLALICAGCETYFYIGVSKEVGANTGRITLG